MVRCCFGRSRYPADRSRSLSLKNLSLRHHSPVYRTGSKKMKGKKSQSSGDVREVKDEVKAVVSSSGYSSSTSPLTPTPPLSPSSPTSPTPTSSAIPPSPQSQDPGSRRGKLWNSFRMRTKIFKRRNRGEKDRGAEPVSPTVGNGTTDDEGDKADAADGGAPTSRTRAPRSRSRPKSCVSRSSSEEVTESKSRIRRWRSDIVRQVSVRGEGTDKERVGEDNMADQSTPSSPLEAKSATVVEEQGNGAVDTTGGEGKSDFGEMVSAATAKDGSGKNGRKVAENDEGDSGIALGDPAFLQASETALRQRQTALMEHPFFLLEVRLKEGVDLVIRDSCGTSDPYVKFKIAGKQVYKSRTIFKNLNPKWEETFTLPMEDITKPLYLKVFDYDRGFHDDPMGNALIDVSQLQLGNATDLKLELSERGKTEYMGYLLLTCTLQPKTQEDKDQFLRRTVRVSGEGGGGAVSKKVKLQMWTAVVTIVLVDGANLVPMDDNGLSDPYVKFRLAAEKYRSKIKTKTLSPRWLEQFDLRLFNEQSSQLEITVFDYDVTKDDFMGRATVDISSLEAEVTHRLEVELEDGAGTLTLLVTVSGLWGSDSVSDLSNYTPDPGQQEKLIKHYSPLKLTNIADVGHLQVKVFKASGLKAADLGGLSDPFCVLELVNARRQTHTEYKTLNPEWNKIFQFPVLDIHSVLEVTVFDEDRDKKVEFLGKVAIPLLKIKSGERKWYALKDRKLITRSKGAILMEMNVVFNHVKAAVRTVNPADTKLMQVEPKFKIHLMKRNIDRVSQLVSILVEGGKFLQSCFCWESKARSISAFIIFLILVWNFEPYMLPITLLIVFLKNLLIAQIVGALRREAVEDECLVDDEDDEDDDKEKNTKVKEEKKSFKEKLQSIQEVCLQVQQGMDMVASLGERVKNTFNWTVPWLSTLALVALSVGVFVLYYVPLRWLILAWGINKFTKKLRKPDAISNNELLDFLSRVPSDSELSQYRELRPELSPAPKKKRS